MVHHVLEYVARYFIEVEVYIQLSADRVPVFNQLCIIEADAAINHCMSQSANNSCRNDVMRTIHNVMEVHIC